LRSSTTVAADGPGPSPHVLATACAALSQPRNRDNLGGSVTVQYSTTVQYFGDEVTTSARHTVVSSCQPHPAMAYCNQSTAEVLEPLALHPVLSCGRCTLTRISAIFAA
jgi:hypothetical protein